MTDLTKKPEPCGPGSESSDSLGKDTAFSICVRASLRPYAAGLAVFSFGAALLIYLGYPGTGLLLFSASAIALTGSFLTDHIVFTGRRIHRTGAAYRLWAALSQTRRRLAVSQIEQVETQTLRRIRRGTNVHYGYRTTFRGQGLRFTVTSSSRRYIDFVRAVVHRLNDDLLDGSTIELRDYLADRNVVVQRAKSLQIPSDEVLQNSIDGTFRRPKEKNGGRNGDDLAQVDGSKADELRRLANQLRLCGFLLQSYEAFRRAAVLKPYDGRLLLEFARCVRSIASVEKDGSLERRSVALLRLSERRAANDGVLLAQLGENYLQAGEAKRARYAFQKSIDRIGGRYRALRGLAELALFEGKIAHTIQHLSSAAHLAVPAALRRWTRLETEYFVHLNDNEEYFELEISRLRLLEVLVGVKRSAIWVFAAAVLLVPLGLAANVGTLADLGWTVSGLAIFTYLGTAGGIAALSPRIPFDLAKED